MNELPPFSFSKKPISDPLSTAKSSLHSNISDVLSAFQITPKKKHSNTESVEYRDFDYDEKIRFPRMSNVNNYTYNPCVKPGFMSRKSSCEDKKSIKEDKAEEPVDFYSPATFDLTTPLRRFSFQPEMEDIAGNLKKYFQVESPSELAHFNEDNLKLLTEYISDNYIYERNLEQKKSSSNSLSSLGLQNVYSCKKPMSVPAVLRPNVPTQSEHAISVNGSSFVVSTVRTSSCDEEPTHAHWKANSLANHCMQCFQTFDYLIVSLVRSVLDHSHTTRRHHCRFCGFVYCSDCLAQSEQDSGERVYTTADGSFVANGILLDGQARFVIPNLARNVKPTGRLSKVCRGCGEAYKQLVVVLNKREWAEDMMYVENPYINKAPVSMQWERRVEKVETYRDRKESMVPSDWSWSSF